MWANDNVHLRIVDFKLFPTNRDISFITMHNRQSVIWICNTKNAFIWSADFALCYEIATFPMVFSNATFSLWQLICAFFINVYAHSYQTSHIGFTWKYTFIWAFLIKINPEKRFRRSKFYKVLFAHYTLLILKYLIVYINSVESCFIYACNNLDKNLVLK